MPKKPQAMIRLLKRKGFTEVKCNKGSHRRFVNSKTGRMTEVPIHGGKELKKNVERMILEEAGIEDD
ncbi:MAG: type II toxin-antitoxin system HicA family toxin [Selenomonadaceae bacterium]|nr:type II toxin-antitoxin system HicA family toxin [Selenomonadaceae bacterium]MBR3721316.1 type II toxin-antitoxin system HicA family toxin [Selenomonadaceae bacterium]